MEIKQMLTQKNCYVGRNDPKYIVVHETDNWSPGAGAVRHGQAMQNGNLAGTVHYYVDDANVVQTLRHTDGAWAVGDGKGKYGITNYNSINLEICVNPESDYYKAVENAVWLVRRLMDQTGIDLAHVVRHYDASRKHCPRRILDEGLWDGFKAKVQGGGSDSNTDSTPGTAGSYTVKSGDTLSGIAAAYGMTLTELIQLNPQISNPNLIHPGDTVKLSSGASSAPAPAPAPAPVASEVDVYYWVATQKHGRLPKVKNQEDFAGFEDSPVTKVAIQTTKGSVKYRVHIKGGEWLPYVTGYDANDHVNGYAGNGQPIDALEVYYTTPNGMAVKKAKYRVAPCGGDYYGWQYDNETGGGQDGYAGVFGKAIGKVQIVIE